MPTFAIKNGNDLLTDMTTLLPDNSTQEISPLDHRTVQGQAICSSINKLDNKPLLGVKDYDNTRGITPTLAYEAGELAMQAGVIYQANVDIALSEVFTPGNWTARGLPGAANGLSTDGSDVILGGTVDRPTTITGIGNTNLLKFEAEQLEVQIDKLGFKSVNSNGGFGIGGGVPLVYGIKGDVSFAFNDESRAIWGVATNTDVGIAGYFDSFSNFTKSNALVTDRGNIGFNWTDFDVSTTLSLINVKSKTDAITNNTYTQYDTLGTTRTARISDEGSAFFNSQVSVGEDRLSFGQALSVVCDDNAVGIRVWANTGSTTTNNVVFDLNKDKTVGLGGNYDPAYSEPIQAKNNMTVVKAGQPFFTIRTTNGNSSRLFWSGWESTKDWGLLATTKTTAGFEDASIWEFKNVTPAFTTDILWGKFVKEEDTDTNNGEEWIEWRKNKVVNITGTSFAPSNLDTDASIDFIDTNKGVKINGGTTAQRPTGSERMAYVTSDIGANGSLSIYSNGAWRDINL